MKITNKNLMTNVNTVVRESILNKLREEMVVDNDFDLIIDYMNTHIKDFEFLQEGQLVTIRKKLYNANYNDISIKDFLTKIDIIPDKAIIKIFLSQNINKDTPIYDSFSSVCFEDGDVYVEYEDYENRQIYCDRIADIIVEYDAKLTQEIEKEINVRKAKIELEIRQKEEELNKLKQILNDGLY